MTDTKPLSQKTKLIAFRAFMAGRRAALSSRPVTECPFHPRATASDATDAVAVNEAIVERFLARMWIKGWNRQAAKMAR